MPRLNSSRAKRTRTRSTVVAWTQHPQNVGTGVNFQSLWGILVTTSGFGKALFDFANDKPLELLAATLTRDPFTGSAVTFAEWLPWLLFGLLAGALLDRLDRLRVMWMVDAGHLLIVGGLAAAVLAGWASIPLLMVTGFLLGTGQTLVDTGSQA